MRRKFQKHPFVRFWISYKVTLACLVWLFVLTVWGTVYQVNFGLYPAQQLIFNSWLIPVMGWIPFPGARFILWILFVNLSMVTLFRFQYKWSKAGLLILHSGMFLLMFSSWVTFHYAVESNLTLEEGQGSNVTASYHHWELSVWTQKLVGDTLVKEVEAFDFNKVHKDQSFPVPKYNLSIEVLQSYPNCKALLGPLPVKPTEYPRNVSGIVTLQEQKTQPIPQDNTPGIDIRVSFSVDSGVASQRLILYGGEGEATPMVLGSEVLFFSLRQKRFPMPVMLTLIDFKKEEYVGTQMAKSFSSKVEMISEFVKREVIISMNQPLRVGNHTFYQASFSQSNQGEASTLAVVEHPGRLLPYISSIVVGIGLCLHFILMLFKYSRKQYSGKKNGVHP